MGHNWNLLCTLCNAFQNGFCRAYPGVSKCLDCGSCDGDFPSSKYCRFLEFRKYVSPTHPPTHILRLRIPVTHHCSVSTIAVSVYVCVPLFRLCVGGDEEPSVSVQGFADYKDVTTQDLVPWTPLRTSQSAPSLPPFPLSCLAPFCYLPPPSLFSTSLLFPPSLCLPPFCSPTSLLSPLPSVPHLPLVPSLPPVPSLPSLRSPSLLFSTSLLFPPSLPSIPSLLPPSSSPSHHV